jgi:hypothetical protein
LRFGDSDGDDHDIAAAALERLERERATAVESFNTMAAKAAALHERADRLDKKCAALALLFYGSPNAGSGADRPSVNAGGSLAASPKPAATDDASVPISTTEK